MLFMKCFSVEKFLLGRQEMLSFSTLLESAVAADGYHAGNRHEGVLIFFW